MDNKKLREENIDIRGMHCGSCAKLIESTLNSLKGVESTKASLIDGKALVKFDPQKINLDKIKSKIKALEYGVDGEEPKLEKNKSFWSGLAYGLVPHIGCIGFIIASVIGTTVAMNVFKPLLMNPYIFHILVGISIMFATTSSLLYLRKNDLLSLAGMKFKKKYLTSMYGSTVGINLVLFFLIFPLLANITPVSAAGVTGAAGLNLDDLDSIQLQVKIPCPGHAPLISNELRTISGVAGVEYSFPNNFDVSYDSSQTSEDEILTLEVFETYPATVSGDSGSSSGLKTTTAKSTGYAAAGGCGGGCGSGCGGGSGGCGGGCGG